MCDDDNPCTCDTCSEGNCRHIPAGMAPWWCSLPSTCCTSDKDCTQLPATWMKGLCQDGICGYSVPEPGAELPLLDAFGKCLAPELTGWLLTASGDGTQVVSECTHIGALGPDNHRRLAVPAIQEDSFHAYLSTPRLAPDLNKPVTVQFDFDIVESYAQVGLYAHLDEAPCAVEGQPFVSL